MNKKIYRIAICAMIAAMYAVLTIVLGFMSFGGIQFRIAEALTVLPYFSVMAVPGLTIGCLISNLFSPVGLPDVIVGTLATLLASILTRLCAKKKLKWLAPLPPVVINAVAIGLLLMFESGSVSFVSFAVNAAGVGAGQAVCCYGLGLPLLILLEKNPKITEYMYFYN